MKLGSYVTLKENSEEHAIVINIVNNKATLDRNIEGLDEYPLESLSELSIHIGFRIDSQHRAEPDQTRIITEFDPDCENIKEAFKIISIHPSITDEDIEFNEKHQTFSIHGKLLEPYPNDLISDIHSVRLGQDIQMLAGDFEGNYSIACEGDIIKADCSAIEAMKVISDIIENC